MKISIDTKEDSHEEIRKVIKMLQNLVGDSQEVFTNQPESQENTASPIANIFGDVSAQPQETASAPAAETQETQSEESSESTEDLFAELFSEEELKKMDVKKEEEDEEVGIKPKDKRHSMEFY